MDQNLDNVSNRLRKDILGGLKSCGVDLNCLKAFFIAAKNVEKRFPICTKRDNWGIITHGCDNLGDYYTLFYILYSILEP